VKGVCAGVGPRHRADAAGFRWARSIPNFPEKEAILLELVQRRQSGGTMQIEVALDHAK
jgi:hypothetical protein